MQRMYWADDRPLAEIPAYGWRLFIATFVTMALVVLAVLTTQGGEPPAQHPAGGTAAPAVAEPGR
jgi:hypothetical protein